MSRAAQLTDTLSLAWLLVAPEAAGRPTPQAPISPQSPWVLDALTRLWPNLPPDSISGIRGVGRDWWVALRQASTALLMGPGARPRVTMNLRLDDPVQACQYAVLRLLPPELLCAANTNVAMLATDSPLDPALSHEGERVDLHVHLYGAIPESAVWRAVMAGMPLAGAAATDHGPQRTSQAARLVVEARFLRASLAERLTTPALGWATFVADSGVAYRTGEPPDEVVAAAANVVHERFLMGIRSCTALSAPDYSDVLAAASGYAAVDSPEYEQALLRACLSTVADPESSRRRDAARYVQLRCAMRAWSLLSPGETGLVRFARRYFAVGAVMGSARSSRPGVDATELSRPHSTDTRKLRWAARLVHAQLAAGASDAEFRTSLGTNAALVGQNLSALLHEFSGVQRFGILQQLHRTGDVDEQLRSVEAVNHWRRENRAIASLVSGVDLAGPECGAPPWRHCGALQAAKRAGMRVSVHAGEVYDHPLLGLHWIDWCIRAIPMSRGDRVGHALALLDSPREGIVSVRAWAAALGWAHGVLAGRPEISDIAAAYTRLKTSFQRLPTLVTWEAAALSSAPDSRAANVELWFVNRGEIRTRAWRLLTRAVEQRFITSGVVREVCPASNRQVAGWPERFRVPHAAARLPVVLGTDDPGLLGTSLAAELSAWQASGPGPTRLRAMLDTTRRHSAYLRTGRDWLSLVEQEPDVRLP